MLAFLLLPGFMPYLSPYDDVRVCKPAKLVVEIIRDLSKTVVIFRKKSRDEKNFYALKQTIKKAAVLEIVLDYHEKLMMRGVMGGPPLVYKVSHFLRYESSVDLGSMSLLFE